MKITDEMVSKACDAYCEAAAGANDGIRAALDFVAPLIRSAALEEAAKVAHDLHSPSTADAIRALKDQRTPTAGDFV